MTQNFTNRPQLINPDTLDSYVCARVRDVQGQFTEHDTQQLVFNVIAAVAERTSCRRAATAAEIGEHDKDGIFQMQSDLFGRGFDIFDPSLDPKLNDAIKYIADAFISARIEKETAELKARLDERQYQESKNHYESSGTGRSGLAAAFYNATSGSSTRSTYRGMTTMALGEEDTKPPPRNFTTFAMGEEDTQPYRPPVDSTGLAHTKAGKAKRQ